MKKCFCDVCGVEIGEGGNAPSGWAEDLCGLEDLCPRCEGFARKLDASALVLKELRRMVAEPDAPQPPAPANTPPPVPKGKAAKEKRAILAAIDAFRREHGPGSISKLAKQAKVGEGDLRAMTLYEPAPIAIWRKVGKALAASGIDGNGGNDGTADTH